MPIHVAITRQVQIGREAEFEATLREFFRRSFDQSGVLGASMIVPFLNSASREYGILRSFSDEAKRDAFYASALFKDWNEQVGPLTEGVPVRRQLHGLEAWFQTSLNPPPRWKMAALTFVGAYAISLLLAVAIGPLTGPWPLFLRTAVFTALMVAGLTWVIMPTLTRVAGAWLKPSEKLLRASK
jgi:antibiotic biosynthesis monooxygenase (ABM) superfamily enzyme